MMGKPYSVAVASDRKVAKGKNQVPPMTVSCYMSYMFVCVFESAWTWFMVQIRAGANI